MKSYGALRPIFRCRLIRIVIILIAAAPFAVGQIPPTPQLNSAVNAASFDRSGILSPGVVFTIFGSSLTDGATAAASALPLLKSATAVCVNPLVNRHGSIFDVVPLI